MKFDIKKFPFIFRLKNVFKMHIVNRGFRQIVGANESNMREFLRKTGLGDTGYVQRFFKNMVDIPRFIS